MTFDQARNRLHHKSKNAEKGKRHSHIKMFTRFANPLQVAFAITLACAVGTTSDRCVSIHAYSMTTATFKRIANRTIAVFCVRVQYWLGQMCNHQNTSTADDGGS